MNVSLELLSNSNEALYVPEIWISNNNRKQRANMIFKYALEIQQKNIGTLLHNKNTHNDLEKLFSKYMEEGKDQLEVRFIT